MLLVVLCSVEPYVIISQGPHERSLKPEENNLSPLPAVSCLSLLVVLCSAKPCVIISQGSHEESLALEENATLPYLSVVSCLFETNLLCAQPLISLLIGCGNKFCCPRRCG